MTVSTEMVTGRSLADSQPTSETRQFPPPQLQLVAHFDGEIVIQEFSGDDRRVIANHGASLVNLYCFTSNVYIVLHELWGTLVYHRGKAMAHYPRILGQPEERQVLLPDGTKRIQRYLAGAHPHLGKIVQGYQGTETLQEIHLISV